MRRVLLAAFATAAIGFIGTPAQAATVLNATCSGNCFTSPLVDIVNLVDATGTSLGKGTVNGVTVDFTSSSDLMDLKNGAATIETTDGSLFGQLTFTLEDGVGFTYADFALDQGSSPLTLDFTLSDGTHQSVSITHATGSEPFGIQADAGTFITSVSLNTTGDSTFKTFKQLKLGGFSTTAPVPEPGTWALMLLGFGGIGVAMRRGRKQNALLSQIA